MRGSIAIWQDTLGEGANGYVPRAEIHINIWKGDKRNTNRPFHLFDIGIRFKEVRSLRTLSICLPFAVDASQISDLFQVMHDNNTLSAIFNETLRAGEMQSNSSIFTAFDERDRIQFHVARCFESDRSIASVGTDDDTSTIILLNDDFFNRLRERIGDQYLRLRVSVPFDAPNGFVSEVDPKDRAFLSAISTNEIVEFRLNERRNFSPAILGRLNGKVDLIEVSAVHYFLIRDMTVEMTQSHTNFRKMRRLEPGIWDQYLQNEPQIDPANMIIYHWSSVAQHPNGVDSFTALATFRAYRTDQRHIYFYAMVVVALGAAGSAFQSLWAAFLAGRFSYWGWKGAAPTLLANIAILAVLCLTVIYLVNRGRSESPREAGRAIGRSGGGR